MSLLRARNTTMLAWIFLVVILAYLGIQGYRLALREMYNYIGLWTTSGTSYSGDITIIN